MSLPSDPPFDAVAGRTGSRLPILRLILIVLWSGLAWGIYALVNLVGDGLIRNADLLPLGPYELELLSAVMLFVQKFGFAAVIALWAIGVLAILAVGWLARRAIAARRGS
jgi:hypothetical protein